MKCSKLYLQFFRYFHHQLIIIHFNKIRFDEIFGLVGHQFPQIFILGKFFG